MLLGGYLPPGRAAEVDGGRRPANDVHVLVGSFDARVFDFGWLEEPGAPRRRRALAWVARRTGQWSAALAIATAFEVRRFATVYVSGEDVGVVACALSRVIPGSRPRFVVRIERPVYGRTAVRRFIHRRSMWFASKRVDVALCRTTPIARYVRERTRAADVIAFGQEIDTDFFDPARHGPVGDEPVADGPFILSAGLERRDYATLLDAVDDCPAGLVIAAGSPWSKDTFSVDRELLEGTVVDTFDPIAMRELYRHAAVVVLSVHPTDRACGMNVIGEAWAMGRPVVASATDGLADFITSGVNGLLVPPGDAVALRDAIERVLGDPELADRLGRAGRGYVHEHLALDRFREVVARSIGRDDPARQVQVQ